MRLVALLLASSLVACASAPPAPPRVEIDTRAALAAVRASGAALPAELDVRPLMDPQVLDLLELAATHEQAGRVDASARAIDQALELSPGDPALLQARAEAALLQGDFTQAQALAQRSHAAGPKLGPLCRRQMETQVQAALAQSRLGDAGAAARAEAARTGREACTVTPPPRY